jgi:hypothetical protein
VLGKGFVRAASVLTRAKGWPSKTCKKLQIANFLDKLMGRTIVVRLELLIQYFF